jgi:hypothetical protein
LGDEPRPLGSSGSEWVSNCDVATATIIGRLDLSQFAHVRELEEDPAGMWQRLKETHEGILGGVVVVWEKFYALRKSGDPGTMRAHIAAVRGLAAQKLGRLYNDKPSDSDRCADYHDASHVPSPILRHPPSGKPEIATKTHGDPERRHRPESKGLSMIDKWEGWFFP